MKHDDIHDPLAIARAVGVLVEDTPKKRCVLNPGWEGILGGLYGTLLGVMVSWAL